MKTKKKKIRQVTHYAIDDTDFSGDHHSMELFVDDVLALDLTDEYHDQSHSQVLGFLAALDFLGISYTMTEEQVADSDL